MKKYFDLKYLLKFFIKNIIFLISPLISLWEQKYFLKYRDFKPKYQPIFIIGAPRTGSTILYQTITNQLDVLYIDNMICALNKNLFFWFLVE